MIKVSDKSPINAVEGFGERALRPLCVDLGGGCALNGIAKRSDY